VVGCDERSDEFFAPCRVIVSVNVAFDFVPNGTIPDITDICRFTPVIPLHRNN